MSSTNSEFERRALAGEADAIAALWRAHRRWVAAVLLAHLPRDLELEDLLQETAMAMVRHLGTLRDPASLRPWLRTLALNALRSAARRRALERRVHRPLSPHDEALADPAPARARAHAAAVEASQRLLALVQSLHADYREPLLLRSVHGMSQKEIAAILDLPETTVETRLARARRMLRREAVGLEIPAGGYRGSSPCTNGESR